MIDTIYATTSSPSYPKLSERSSSTMNSQSSLFALVDVASLLPPIPSHDETTTEERMQSATVVSDDDGQAGHVRQAASPVPSPSAPSSPSPAPSTESGGNDSHTRPTATTTIAATAAAAATATRKKSRALPLILMELLSDPSQTSDVLSFSDDGESFVILRPHAFAAGPMRDVFRCVKFPTFVKKLEKWGFRQVVAEESGKGHQRGTRTKERLVFAHPLFRRDDWESCRRIRCVGAKNSFAAINGGASNERKRARRPSSSSASASSPSLSSPPPPSSAASSRSSTPVAAPSLRDVPRSVFVSALDERAEAMTRYLRNGSSSSAVSPASLLPPLSQEEVDRATRSVVGAAVEALERDSDMKVQQRQQRLAQHQARIQQAQAAASLRAASLRRFAASGPRFPLDGMPPLGGVGSVGGMNADALALLRMEAENMVAAKRMELELLRRQQGL